MRKLSAAGMLAAGLLGLALQANAQVEYDIEGSFNTTDNSCTQVIFGIGGGDCSYSNGRGNNTIWFGPANGATYYAIGSAGDTPQQPPPGTPVHAAPITGTITVDDGGTAMDGSDDTIAGQIVVGAVARNLITAQFTRGVESWETMTFTVPATTVSFATSNGQGGFTYVIGSQGFPIPICNLDVPANCFPTPSYDAIAPPVLPDDTFDVSWSGPDPAKVGIEASTLLAPPGGNLGATPTVTFTNYQCETIVALTGAPAPTECDNNVPFTQVLLAADPANTLAVPANRWGNLVMQISTSNSGEITEATVYWTHEYYIQFPPSAPTTGVANSWAAGQLTFTGEIPVARCNDDTVEAVAGFSNTFDVLLESCNGFPDGASTVTIVTPPTNGTAVVTNNKIDYSPSVPAPNTDSLLYQVDGGGFTDTATLSINIVSDSVPVTPNGQITISTQGVAPTAATGSLNLTTLAGFHLGNGGVVTVGTATNNKGTPGVTGTTVSFTPAATFFSGEETFQYTVTDGQGDTSSGTITVIIANVNPTISGGSISTDQDEASLPLPLTFTLGNGSGAQHTLSIGTQATGGACTLSTSTATSGATVTYTPNSGFFGPDSCVVRITDGDNSVADGTITINVAETSNDIRLPGGGGAVDGFSLALLAGLPLLLRRRRSRSA